MTCWRGGVLGMVTARGTLRTVASALCWPRLKRSYSQTVISPRKDAGWDTCSYYTTDYSAYRHYLDFGVLV